MKITADTITDAQILDLIGWLEDKLDTARLALTRGNGFVPDAALDDLHAYRRRARARCAEILNARTDEQIRELMNRACECRGLDGKPPLGGTDEHAALHDCDVDIYEDCVRALDGDAAARARCTEILNARNTEAR